MSTTATEARAASPIFNDGTLPLLVEQLQVIDAVFGTLSRTLRTEVSLEDAIHCATISVARNDTSGRPDLVAAIKALAKSRGVTEEEALRMGITQYYHSADPPVST